MDGGTEWHEDVDVVCTDAAFAGLATAISTLAVGGEAFVASADPAGPATRRGWFGADVDEPDTTAYFHELTADLDLDGLRRLDDELPIRLAGAQPSRGRTAPTFEGARLRDWAARCIPSPTGYLYTRVTDWPATEMESADGDPVAVTEIGELTVSGRDTWAAVGQWLAAEADERGVRTHPVARFERLVFEHGVVVGAVFGTSDGPLAVRARHGVLVCRAVPPMAPAASSGTAFRVALVGKAASRFGRVELLTADPAGAHRIVPGRATTPQPH